MARPKNQSARRARLIVVVAEAMAGATLPDDVSFGRAPADDAVGATQVAGTQAVCRKALRRRQRHRVAHPPSRPVSKSSQAGVHRVPAKPIPLFASI